jgi:hypothetical protein
MAGATRIIGAMIATALSLITVQDATAQCLNDGNAEITALKQQLRPMEQKLDRTE